MGDRNEIKLIGVPNEIELRPDIGADDESVAFCFKKVDEVTFKARIPPEAIAIMLGAVRLVRCKQCIHAPYDGEEQHGVEVRFPDDVCPFNCCDPWYNARPAPEFFCSFGERREGGADG